MRYIIILALLFPVHLFAQLTKGDTFISGSILYAKRNETDGNVEYDLNTINVFPRFGFLLNEKIAIGAIVGYSHREDSYFYPFNGQITVLTTKTFSAGVFGRRYYKLKEKFQFVIQSEISYERYHDSRNESKITSLSLGVTPLFAFFPSTRWSLEAGFGRIYYTREINTDGSSFGVNYGSLTFGVSYYFRK